MFLNLVLFCSIFVTFATGDQLVFTECDNTIGKLDSLVIPGDPILVGTSNPLNISLSGSIYDNIDQDVQLALKIKKQFYIFGSKTWVTVPCIDMFGSCTMSLLDYFHKYNSTFLCDFLTKMGKSCDLPLQPGSYSISEYLKPVDLSGIPSSILALAGGQVKIHLEITKGKMLYCLDALATIELESKLEDSNQDGIHSDNNAEEATIKTESDNFSEYEPNSERSPFWNH